MKFNPVDDYFSEDYQVPRTFDYNKLDYQVLGFKTCIIIQVFFKIIRVHLYQHIDLVIINCEI